MPVRMIWDQLQGTAAAVAATGVGVLLHPSCVRAIAPKPPAAEILRKSLLDLFVFIFSNYS